MNTSNSAPALKTRARKTWRLLPYLFAIALVAIGNAAHAQEAVAVQDEKVGTNTRDTADNTKDTADNTKDTAKYTKKTSEKTDQIQKDMKADFELGDNSSPGDRVANPGQYPLAQSALNQDLAGCKKLPSEQLAGCEEIAKTEDAQYQYMKTMYENTDTRDKRLRAILQERDALNGSSNLGKLEDNTNKLIALYDLMALDRQQMESVNNAYETRLRYLRASQTKLAHAAASGKKLGDTSIAGVDISQIATAVTTGLALKGALDVIQKDKPEGMRTLGTEKSHGYGL